MSTQTTIAIAKNPDPGAWAKTISLVEFAADFRGTSYGLFVGCAGRARFFTGRNAFARGMRAYQAKIARLGYVTFRNAAGPVAQAA